MDYAFLRERLRHAGPWRTLLYYCGRGLEASSQLQVFRLLCLTPDSLRDGPLEDAGGCAAVDRQRLLDAARDPSLQLPRAEVEAALARGEVCYGAFAGEALASYDWCSRGPSRLTLDLHVKVGPEWGYSRWAFTGPRHRGQGLHARVKRFALAAEVGRGRRGLLSLVEVTNTPSLRSGDRAGCRKVGWLVTFRLAGRRYTYVSAGGRRHGLEVAATPPAAELASATAAAGGVGPVEIRVDSHAPPRWTRLRQLAGRVVTTAARTGRSRLAVVRRALWIWRRARVRPGEALALGLGDPAVPAEVVDGFFAKPVLMALQDALNPRDLVALTEDKGAFYLRCEALGIPVPRTYAVVQPGGGWLAGGAWPASPDEWQRRLAELLPETFVTKPALGVYGEAVTVWSRRADGFVDHRGEACSAAGLHRRLVSHPKYRQFIVQERLTDHPELARLTACPFLQTLRVTTLLGADGVPRLLYAFGKLIGGGDVIDNYRGGTAGNLVVNVDCGRGLLSQAFRPSPDGVGLEPVPVHPVTGARIEGFALPDWPAAVDLALRCARLFLPLRTVGWDLALTPRGPVVVEGNRWWDPPNFTVLGPLPPGAARHDMVEAAPLLRREAAQARRAAAR